MNPRLAILTLTLIATPWTTAQKVVQEPQEDPVQAAIREFNRRDSNTSGLSNEVTVVLEPATEPIIVPPPAAGNEEPAPPKAAVLVTGRAPEGTELIEETGPPAPVEQIPEEPAPAPRKGLNVRVEKIQTGTTTIDPSKVKLLAPFPAKPLAQPPAGWRLETSENAPPFTREVELSPGKSITLTVHPHLLVPDTHGTDTFTVSEPGFDPALGYRQDATAGAVLATSIRQLDEDSKQLGNVIDNLQQLLVSLPKPEPEPEPETTTRKR